MKRSEAKFTRPKLSILILRDIRRKMTLEAKVADSFLQAETERQLAR